MNEQSNSVKLDTDDAVVIGDIHGCVRSLEALWEKLEPVKDRPHIFVGDYIDRGEDSKGVVDFLLSVQSERRCIFLRGNHEQMLMSAENEDKFEIWMRNGGRLTMKSYGYPASIHELPPDHLEFYRTTLMYCELPSYFIVHAGIPANVSIQEATAGDEHYDYMLWERLHLNAFETPWEKTVIFGHTARAYPIRRDKMLGIDTGCVYDSPGLGKLTAVQLPEMTFVQQYSLDQTYSIK